MIEFVIKSTICLGVLYGFYHFLLRNVKTPVFNRFYLLFSLVFAIVIPLINIRMNLDMTFRPDIHKFSNETGILIQGEKLTGTPVQQLTFQSILIFFYIIISILLLLRFTLNIFRIIRLIRTSPRVNHQKTQIVLVEKTALPYSFWRTIFVNRSDYENGKIEKELIIHEQTHCMQYHSIDIIVIELVKIILWFNPFVWLFRKAIQLNHEYLADHKVLSDHDLYDYQNTLVNLVFRNNSTYLASNFNYSLTKKRLIMMTKNNASNKTIFRKIAAVPIILILAVTLTFSQETKQNETGKVVANFENEWWYPILKKHGISVDGNKFDISFIADKFIDNSYQNITIAFNEGDTAIFIVVAPEAIINMDNMNFEFSNGKQFHYFKNGDFENGTFKSIKINKNSSRHNKKTVTEEQSTSFQEKLADERKAAAEEQNATFQKKLADERKAAFNGTIATGKL